MTKNNEIVRWYVEKAIKDMLGFTDREDFVGLVLKFPEQHPTIILRALELAVKDVG